MEEAKKVDERWLFSQIIVINRFTKNPDSYPANSLKRNTSVFPLPWRKKYKKLTMKYLNLECECGIRTKNHDLDASASYKKEIPY